MKKFVLISTSIFMLFVLASCSEDTTNKRKEEQVEETVKQVDYEGYELEENHIYKSITPEELEGLILDKKDVYVFFGRNT